MNQGVISQSGAHAKERSIFIHLPLQGQPKGRSNNELTFMRHIASITPNGAEGRFQVMTSPSPDQYGHSLLMLKDLGVNFTTSDSKTIASPIDSWISSKLLGHGLQLNPRSL
jgi:hypothetical protein